MARAIELNRFITNGISTRTGEYKSIQLAVLSPETFFSRYLRVPETGSAKQKLRQAILNAVRLRPDQVFDDGNHRTAILLLYEVLSEHKLLLQAKPVTLYIMLSNRSHFSEHGRYAWSEIERMMYQHCRHRLKLVSKVASAEERVHLYINAVKSLDIVNSLFNQCAKLVYSPEWYKVARQLKRLDRGFYDQFYRLCMLGGWVGSPRDWDEDA